MLCWRTVRFVALFSMGLCSMAPPVCAQPSQGTRPFRGLFGSDSRGAGTLHHIDLSFGANAAAENASFGPTGPESEAPADDGRFEEYYIALGQLSYARRGRTVQFASMGGASYPYYSLYPNKSQLAYDATTDFTASSRTTSFNAAAGYHYSPYYSLDFGNFRSDYASAYSPNNVVTGGASLRHNFSRQTSAAVSYSAGTTVFLDDDRKTRSQGFGASADHRLTRTTTIRGGYSYNQLRTSEFGADLSTVSRSNSLDVGIGYTKRLSSIRQLTVEASVGVNAVTPSAESGLYWRGSLQGTLAMSRSWTAGVGYLRNLQNISGFLQPVWADHLTAQVAGYVGRRLGLSVGAYYVTGNDLIYPTSKFYNYGGQARAQFGLSPNFAVYTQYMYYRYEYPSNFDLPEGMSPMLGRHRIQAGVSTWFPLLRTGRAPSAGSQ